jgi:TP901 family phage tail tape measure protein
MAGIIASLVVRISANIAEFEKNISQAEKSFARTGKKLESIGSNLTKGLTLPIAAAGGAAIAAALKIDDALDTIRISTGKTGKAFEGLTDSFKTVAAQVPSSVEDVAAAIGELNVRTGASGTLLENMATQQLDLARMTKADLIPQIEATTQAFGAWTISAEEQGDALDFLFKVSQATRVGVTQLASIAGESAATFKQLGFSFEEAAVIIGKFEKEGVNTEAALIGMKKGLIELAKAGKTPTEAFNQLIETIKKAPSEHDKLTAATKLFGKAAVTMVSAIEEGRFAITGLVDEVRKSPETIAKASKATEGFAEKFLTLKNQVLLALDPIGVQLLNALERLMPMVLSAVKWLADLAKKFADLPQPVQLTALAFVGVAAAIGPLLIGLGQLSLSFAGILKLMPTVTNLFKGFEVASLLAAAPMVALGVVIAGLVVEIVALTGALGDTAQEMAWSITPIGLAQTALEKLRDVAPKVAKGIDDIASIIRSTLIIEFHALKDAVNTVIDVFKRNLLPTLERVATVIRTVVIPAIIEAAATVLRSIPFFHGLDLALEAIVRLAPSLRKSLENSGTALSSTAVQMARAADKAQGFISGAHGIEVGLVTLPGAIQKVNNAAGGTGPALGGAGDAADKFAKALKGLREQLAGGNLLDTFRQWQIVLKEIGGVQRLTHDETARYTDVIFALLEKFRALGPAASAAWQKAAAAAMTALGMIEAQVVPVISGINNIINKLGQLDVELTKVAVTAGIPFDMFGMIQLPGRIPQEARPTAGTLDIAGIGKSIGLEQLPNLFLKQMGDTIRQGLAPTLLQAFTGGGNVAKSAGAFLGGGLAESATKSITGFLSKSLGPTLGGIFGSVIPGLGTILGGAVGGLFDKLFGGQAKKTREMRDAFLEQAGGLQKLKASADAVGFSLDKMLSTKKTKEFEKEVRALEQATADFQKRMEGLSMAVEGVNRKAELFAAPFTKLLSERAKLTEEIKLGRLDSTELATAQARLEEITLGLSGLAAHGQAEFERLGIFAAATFAGMVRQTGSAIGAIQAMAPTFTVLQQGLEDFGLTGTATIRNLVDMFKLVTDEGTAPLFESLAAIDQIFTGLQQAGVLTGETFQTVGADVGQIFRDLEAKGVDMNKALALSQPTLQKLWEAQQKYGLVTDETTQKILKQAEEQGLVGDHMKDVNEKILDVLLAIGEVLGAKLPAALRGLKAPAVQAGQDIKDALTVRPPPITVPVRFSSTGARIDFEGGGSFNIPGFQHGGVVNRPTLAYLGETGPEAVIPLDRLTGSLEGPGEAGPINVYVAIDPASKKASVLSEDQRRLIQNWMFSGRLQVPTRAVASRGR